NYMLRLAHCALDCCGFLDVCVFFFFFFQAEDGIRDRTVTGVQTCALPISGIRWITMPISADGPEGTEALCEGMPGKLYKDCRGRSEERRVGKECRSRWSPDH